MALLHKGDYESIYEANGGSASKRFAEANALERDIAKHAPAVIEKLITHS